MIRPQFQVGIFQESSTLPPQADPAAVPSRLFSVRNLKRVRTQNGGDFHVHVALREAMHDRRIADIERASLRVRSAQGKATSFTIHPLITDGHAESSLISAGMLLVPDGAGTCKTHTSGGQEGHAGAFCVLARQVAS